MKFFFLISAVAGITLASACGQVSDGVNQDSIHQAEEARIKEDSLNKLYCLESLLMYNSETEFVKQYGSDVVKYDTIWGAEGFFYMGTVMKIDTISRVELTWMNEEKRERLISATVVSESDWYGDTLAAGMWKSCTGIKLGMSLEQVEKINGRPFTFSGFGWDYAGGLISWENGTLEGKGISIQMSEGTGYDSLPVKDYEALLGDIPVSSDNVTARKSGARVWSISVAKVQ